MLNAHLHAVVDAVLRSTLSAWGYVNFKLDVRPDHYGDMALFIKPRFDRAGPLPPSQATAEAMATLSQRLRELGDERFPYVDYDYPAELPVDDEAA